MSVSTYKHGDDLPDDELARLRAENARLKKMLRDVANNAPLADPRLIPTGTSAITHMSRVDGWAWSYFVAGQLIYKLLDEIEN